MYLAPRLVYVSLRLVCLTPRLFYLPPRLVYLAPELLLLRCIMPLWLLQFQGGLMLFLTKQLPEHREVLQHRISEHHDVVQPSILLRASLIGPPHY